MKTYTVTLWNYRQGWKETIFTTTNLDTAIAKVQEMRSEYQEPMVYDDEGRFVYIPR